MKLRKFLKTITVDKEPLQGTAAELIERMAPSEFQELIREMKDIGQATLFWFLWAMIATEILLY